MKTSLRCQLSCAEFLPTPLAIRSEYAISKFTSDATHPTAIHIFIVFSSISHVTLYMLTRSVYVCLFSRPSSSSTPMVIHESDIRFRLFFKILKTRCVDTYGTWRVRQTFIVSIFLGLGKDRSSNFDK